MAKKHTPLNRKQLSAAKANEALDRLAVAIVTTVSPAIAQTIFDKTK